MNQFAFSIKNTYNIRMRKIDRCYFFILYCLKAIFNKLYNLYLRKNKDKAKKTKLRQFRYIYFINQKSKQNHKKRRKRKNLIPLQSKVE
mgnify:CR=1 FL=1